MKKRGIALLLALCLVFSLSAPAWAAPANTPAPTGSPGYYNTYVYDQAALFTVEEEAQLSDAAHELAEREGFTPVIVTADDLGVSSSDSYTIKFHDDKGLGVGPTNSCLLMLFDMESQQLNVRAFGNARYKYNSDSLQAILDRMNTKETKFDMAMEFFAAARELAQAPDPVLYDQAELLSWSEEERLFARINAAQDRIGLHIDLVTVSGLAGDQTQAYANEFRANNDLGYGQDEPGILFLLDGQQKTAQAFYYGGAEKYVSQTPAKTLQSALYNNLSKGNYGAVCFSFLLWLEENYVRVEDENNRVFDDADLFTTIEEKSLQKDIEALIEEMGMDVAIVTTRTNSKRSAQAYADDFFDDHHLGLESDERGILMLIDMDNREVALSTKGETIRRYSDAAIEKMLDDITPKLTNSQYMSAVQKFLIDVKVYYADTPTTAVSGNWTVSGGHIPWPLVVLVALLLGAGAGAFACGRVRKQYAMETPQYEYPYRTYSQVDMNEEFDRLLHSFVDSEIIPEVDHTNYGGGSSSSSSHTSTTHTSSSGSTHGGGSRKF